MDRQAGLKILMMTPWYPTRERPAAGVFVREQAKAAGLHGQVAVLHFAGRRADIPGTCHVEQETDEALTEGVPTYRVYYRRLPVLRSSRLARLYGVVAAYRHIAGAGFRPDILHAHVYRVAHYAALLGWLHRLPVVATEHSSHFLEGRLKRGELMRARFALRRARLVLPVSSALQRAMEACGIRARFRVVPNTVDTRVFYPNLAVRGQGTKRVLAVGLLDPAHKKGIPLLLRALALVKQKRGDWCLDVVGDGAARGECEGLAVAAGLGGAVVFHGMKPRAEVADFMRRASLFVVASPVETFGAAAAEALATGTPVLATRCGGPEDFVTEEVGLLVPGGDPEALARGLDTMLDRVALLSPERIARYAAERFSLEAVGEQLRAVYASCLTEAGS